MSATPRMDALLGAIESLRCSLGAGSRPPNNEVDIAVGGPLLDAVEEAIEESGIKQLEAELGQIEALALERAAKHFDKTHREFWSPGIAEEIRKLIPSSAAEQLEGMRRDAGRLDCLERVIRICPHAVLTFSDDPDEEKPHGFSLTVSGCETFEASADSLRGVLDAALQDESDSAISKGAP